MKTKQILITGNMGYVGPAVVRQLRETYPSARLVGLDTAYFAHCLTAASVIPERLLDEQIFMDIRDVPAELLRGFDAVVNLAAISNDPMGSAFEDATAQINCTAGVRLARLAKDAGVKSFVFASSCSVYGFAEGAARKESDSLNPLTAYARSKIGTEQELRGVASADFVVTCLRFPTACGMSERLRLDLVLNDFVACAIATGRIDILSDGTPWRPLIDTNDMAFAIDWAISRGGDRGGQFLAINVGRNECNYQIRELAEAVAAELPGTTISINEHAAPDKRSYRVDFSQYKSLAPGHLPRYGLRDSIRALIAGLRAMQFADSQFRESRHMRLKVLNGLKDAKLLNDRLEWNTRPSVDLRSRVA